MVAGTMLSLFDGSGGFSLAGRMVGIEPVLASEVKPYPIAVTRSRFPKMKHLGSVTEIRGDEIEPVDVVTFGSPCQNLSMAGNRKGLEGNQSKLFYEAIRIIKEMRNKTNGKYPNFAVWENVFGAFSSNKGEDFRAVLQEFIQIAEPTAVMPPVPKGGWAYADCYRGDGWSLAYRTFDAQYWGVPQRRRRIYLALDLGGERAGEILFNSKSLLWHTSQSREAWQSVAEDSADSVGTADSTVGIVPYTLKIRSGCEGGVKEH